MNRVERLPQLWYLAKKHFARLRAETLILSTASDEKKKERVPRLVIDGINYWNNFGRALFLSCAVGTSTGRGQKLVATTIQNRTEWDAIAMAIQVCSKYKPQLVRGSRIDRRFEPAWHDPSVLMRASKAVGLQNEADIVSAFSPFPKEIKDWSCVRNFFAHRNGDTHRAALGVLQPYGLVSGRDIAFLLLQPKLNGSRPLLWDWCIEVEQRCEYLCY